MNRKLRVATLFALGLAAAINVLSADDHATPAGVSPPSASTDLAGMACQIWTVWEGEKGSRTSICYEGKLKAINKQAAAISVQRSRVRAEESLLGIQCDTFGKWKPMAGKEVTIPMDKVESIRFLK